MNRDEGKNAEDIFAQLRADEQSMEIKARARDLIDDVRPYANEMIDRYTMYLTQLGSEERAFAALIKWAEVGVEMGRYDDRGFMAIAAFLARRLSILAPTMARTLN